MLRSIQFITGLVILLACEILPFYFLSPSSDRQQNVISQTAYFISNNIFYFRTIGILILIFPAIHFFWFGSKTSKWLISLAIITYFVILISL
ncbi:hypothetical protein [Chryseosolibacter indicus]|uniref:Uncharacterized protein n=1 Tax=Chryseosolibacter indicus TaxID=2782351 RepID=A0ABS5VXL3_9BACT|nr:hypothetical protein [Chryseosolibacter indicus]MBT1706149.1 hypothetical protein [Chryseosolibacter indicus]